MARFGFLVALLLQAAGGATSQVGSISGRVTDQASGQALPRIVVTLYAGAPAKSVEAITDADGRYHFDGLTPGKYVVAADNDNHRATYLRQWFGNADPADRNDVAPSPAFEIAAGESRNDVNLALLRALAIEGRVLDPLGDPLSHVNVSVSSAQAAQARSARSNDLGAYRIFGLRPGRYRVCASAHDGVESPASADASPPVPNCYPDILLTSQDAFNIDLLVQSSDASRATSEDAVASTQTDQKTGALRGLVRDKQSGRPLAHATVHLGYRGSEKTPLNLAAVTGEDGVFTLSGLPPGPYAGFATATGHLLSKLSDGSNSGELVVRKGEALQVAVTLDRAYAINMRLVDPFDAPVSDVGITMRSAEDGRAVTLPLDSSSDDLGHLRVSGLSPGRYVICAEPVHRGATARAVYQQKRDQLQRTCYGSTQNEAEAQAVTVGNADIDDLELRLVSGRALSISGTILDSSGAPAPQAVVGFAKYIAEGMTTTAFEVRPDGHFQIANVPPGAYAIEATTEREGAFVPLRMTDEDVENLVVSMQKTAKVSGRITVENSAAVLPTEARRAPMLLSARLVDDRLAGDGGSLSATVNSDGTFVLESLFGRRRIDVMNVPSGWYVKAVRYAGKDVLDTPAEFKDGRSLEIVLSNRGATISGAVADVTDHRGGQAQVLLFRAPADDKDIPRLVSSVLSVSGNYSLGPLREGEYIVVAVPADVAIPRRGGWNRLAGLAAAGERVTLSDLENRTIELHVTAVR